MFRLPKNASQSPLKRQQTVSHGQKSQGLCKFPYRQCNLLCLENYNYCLKHILEDKSAPYKPCPFLYTVSGKKCGKPAYRPERKDTWFCPEHTRKNQLLRQKASSRHAPLQTPEALLASLGHYARSSQVITKEDSESEDKTGNSSQAINPFGEIDAPQVNMRCNQILDYASESDSDQEGAMLDNVWRAQDHESSDAESIDSQAEDPLKHAGVFTAEEVTVVIKDKMIRLQSLYIDQFRRLQHLLKERRRKYLHALKKEKETLCSIHKQEKTTLRDHKLYQKLKALNHFHKYYGEEAILHKKALERRAQVTEGNIARTSHKGKCAFTEGGVKCGAKTLPVTKYCRKHILEDSQQVLFRACGFKRDDNTCKEPTLSVFENATCVYHITLPPQPHSPTEETIVKEEVKIECTANKNHVVEKIDESKLMDVEPQKCTEDESPAKPPCSQTTQSDCTTSSEHVEVNKSAEPTEPITSTIPEQETSFQIGTSELPSVPQKEITQIVPEPSSEREDKDEQMQVEDMPINDAKNENPADEFMVDMMSDVGVVEEVLESEEKQEEDTEESVQIELGNGKNVENG